MKRFYLIFVIMASAMIVGVVLIFLTILLSIAGSVTYFVDPGLFGTTTPPVTTASAITTAPAVTTAPAITTAAPAMTSVPVAVPVVVPTTAPTTAPPTCNMLACSNVIDSYIAKNWAYTSSNFGECANCPVVSYPNHFPGPPCANTPIKWSNNNSGVFTRYLDCNGGSCSSPSNRVQIWQPSGAQGQLWTWKNGGVYSGNELLATLNNGTSNGTPVIATTDSGAGGTWGQEWRWQVHPQGGGYQLVNPLSGRCLDISGGVDANGTIAQLWDTATSTTRWST